MFSGFQAVWESLFLVANDPSGINQLYRIRRNGTGKIQMTENTAGPLNDVKLSPDGNFALIH